MPICQTCAHPLILPGVTNCCNQAISCFICLKRHYLAKGECMYCRAKTPAYAMDFPQAVGTLTMQEEDGEADQQFFWLYGSLQNSRWWRFNPPDEKILEDGHTQGQLFIKHKILGKKFEFDLNSMTQKNVSTGFIRPIKRANREEFERLDVKGIAGVQIVERDEDIIQCVYQNIQDGNAGNQGDVANDVEDSDDDEEDMEDEETEDGAEYSDVSDDADREDQ